MATRRTRRAGCPICRRAAEARAEASTSSTASSSGAAGFSPHGGSNGGGAGSGGRPSSRSGGRGATAAAAAGADQISCVKAFRVLGLSPAAGPAEIKRAYRRKVLETHPDKKGAAAVAAAVPSAAAAGAGSAGGGGSGSSGGSAEFQLVQAAYRRLTNLAYEVGDAPEPEQPPPPPEQLEQPRPGAEFDILDESDDVREEAEAGTAEEEMSGVY
eukprot:SAG22_NODE_3328_length_1776_cov_1.011330_1_plen_214_part_00